MKADWDFAGTSYTASSSNSQEVNNLFNICSKVTKQFMADQVFRPSEIQNRSFYTSSYFLGKGVESGLIGKVKSGQYICHVQYFEENNIFSYFTRACVITYSI